MLTRQDKIAILINDYCTIREAINFVKMNKVEFYDLEEFVKNIDDYLEDFCFDDEEKENFKKWLFNEKEKRYFNFSKIEFQEKKYLIELLL